MRTKTQQIIDHFIFGDEQKNDVEYEERLARLLKEKPDHKNASLWENQLQEIRIRDNRCMDCGEGEMHSKGLCVGCLEETEANLYV